VVTSHDIARLAGVSQSTVSRVLQNRPEVSEATRARVRKVLEETGFRPNPAARAMRGTQTDVIGVVIGRVTNPYYPELLDYLGSALHAAGKRMMLWSFVHNTFEEEAVYGVGDQMVDGLIVATGTYGTNALRDALARRAPIVLLNRTIADEAGDRLTGDNAAGARLAVQHLVSLGHTRFGIMGGLPAVSTSVERRAGFLAELRRQGLPVAPAFDLTSAATHDAAYTVAREFLTAPDRPTAVLCASDLLAFGVLDAAQSLGIKVPDELSVVGYDDIAMASWPSYDLTTVHQPLRMLAEVAVSLLLRRLSTPDAPFEVRQYAPELIVRRSTGPAPGAVRVSR
jgi:LacI family transcriptional regulator